MTRRLLTISIICVFALFSFSAFGQDEEEDYMPRDIVWKDISQNSSESMPFGNGNVASNVWVDKKGVNLYLGRNDSFSELGRLLKVGHIRLTASPCQWDFKFEQRLDFSCGTVNIDNEYIQLDIFADSENPIIWIKGDLDGPECVEIEPVIWRKTDFIPEGGERNSMWSAQVLNEVPFAESADQIVSGTNWAGFYHHNSNSIYGATLQNNGLTGEGMVDPFMNRTFGVIMQSDDFTAREDGTLKLNEGVRHFVLKVAVTSFENCSADKWKDNTLGVLGSCRKYKKAKSRTESYWEDTWASTYIEVDTPDGITGKKITDAYNYSRWMILCAASDKYPIKFNGSIFNVDSRYEDPSLDFSPDFRRWGECYWWQNTRLPYYPMLKCGDWENLTPLFRYFQSLTPILKEQAKVYYNADGAIIPETMTQFGTFGIKDFGISSGGNYHPQNMYIRHIFYDPLEIIHMMMDYFRYSRDEQFLQETIVPLSCDFLDFFISRFKQGPDGRMMITETQSMETFWYGVENDMPVVAGLHAIVKDFTTLPKGVMIPPELYKKVSYIKEHMPALPTRLDSDGKIMFDVAAKYENKRSNCENPETLPIFPFKLSTFASDLKDTGIRTFEKRENIYWKGWTYDGEQAAILGLAEHASQQLVKRVEDLNTHYKFPCYYGPNFDWVPDQTHTGNLMQTLQEMVLQCYDNTVYVLPAFPKDWNVKFRLASEGKSFIHGTYWNGRWVKKPNPDHLPSTHKIEVVLK